MISADSKIVTYILQSCYDMLLVNTCGNLYDNSCVAFQTCFFLVIAIVSALLFAAMRQEGI